MIVGMSTSSFTVVHVVVSLIGIFSGAIVLFGMFRSQRLHGWTALFLATTVMKTPRSKLRGIKTPKPETLKTAPSGRLDNGASYTSFRCLAA